MLSAFSRAFFHVAPHARAHTQSAAQGSGGFGNGLLLHVPPTWTPARSGPEPPLSRRGPENAPDSLALGGWCQHGFGHEVEIKRTGPENAPDSWLDTCLGTLREACKKMRSAGGSCASPPADPSYRRGCVSAPRGCVFAFRGARWHLGVDGRGHTLHAGKCTARQAQIQENRPPLLRRILTRGRSCIRWWHLTGCKSRSLERCPVMLD